jgi:hypothetical protein
LSGMPGRQELVFIFLLNLSQVPVYCTQYNHFTVEQHAGPACRVFLLNLFLVLCRKPVINSSPQCCGSETFVFNIGSWSEFSVMFSNRLVDIKRAFYGRSINAGIYLFL